jgi:hypothetical protein
MTTVARPAILLAVALGFVALANNDCCAQGTATSPLPRVYVFTQLANPGQPGAPDQGARQDSVRDLREELRKKPRLLEVVDTSGTANLTIEVLSREAPSATQCTVAVRLRVVGRSEARKFQGESRTWKDAARLVADVIGRWVNESYDTLVQKEEKK